MIFKLLKINKKTQKNKQEKSLGRSMVEMLGVLAIIGVLSIGGIQGYTIAMRKYRANEIANVAIKYAHLSYMSFQNYLKSHFDVIVGTNYEGYFCYYQGDNCCSSNRCGILDFSQSGIGKLPNGIYYLGIDYILPGETSNLSKDPFNSFSDDVVISEALNDDVRQYLESKNLPIGDYMRIAISFEDKQLCKTTASLLSGYIAGGSFVDDADDCDGEYWAYVVKLIPMNN